MCEKSTIISTSIQTTQEINQMKTINQALIKIEAFITEYPIITFFAAIGFALFVGNAGQL